MRIYSDARTTGGGMAAVALLPKQGTEFTAPLTGAAEKVLTDSAVETNEIFGLEMLAMVAAAVALGDRLRGERMILFVDNNAAAGAPTKESTRIQVIVASIESLWGCVKQLSASCPKERVSPKANPADHPSRNKPLLKDQDVGGHLVSLRMVLMLCRVLWGKTKLPDRVI